MRLLALDASTTAVGWSLFQDGEYLDSGVYIPKPSLNWRQRLWLISDWLNDLLCEDTQIRAVAYEIASGNRGNMATHRKLGAVEWLTWAVVSERGPQWIEVNVQQVRAQSCNKTDEGIFNARLYTGKALDGRYAGDEADAVGVGLAALANPRISAIESAAEVAK